MSLIIFNGKIHTMNSRNQIVQAVYIEDGVISRIGTNEEILALKDRSTKLIDCKGRTVLPGFNDSHMHLYNTGLSLHMVELNSSTSISNIIKCVKLFIREKNIQNNKWIKGRGWNQDYFTDEKRFPTRYDLDQISTEHPIVLSRACGHVIVVNSKALKICGIDKNTKQVKGGHFDIDDNDEPLGIFRENALDLIFNSIPTQAIDEIKQTLIDAMKYANSQGITSVQTDDITYGNYEIMINAYKELQKEGKLTCRIYEQCLLPSIHVLKKFLSEGYTTGLGDSYFKIGPLKILSDGSLGARTAALMKPYVDDEATRGIMCYSQEELDEMIECAHNANMHVAVHCIGDRAMYMTLNSIEKVVKNNNEDHRHSIVHCQITDSKLLNKFKELNVLAHVQPIFLQYDLHIVENRIGKELASTSYAFKSMIDKGVHVAFGTDSPVEPLDTMPNIYCAVTRKDLKGYPQKGWNPSEKVSVQEAIYQYTMGSAYASFEENIKGSIEGGKLADIIILNDDVFSVSKGKIKDINIDMTFVGGKIVYKR